MAATRRTKVPLCGRALLLLQLLQATRAQEAVSTAAPWSCDTSISPASSWAAEQKAHCCKQEGVGCDGDLVATATTASSPAAATAPSNHTQAEVAAELRVTVAEALSSEASDSRETTEDELGSVDSDADGMLTESEMSNAIAESGVALSEEETHEVFESFDATGDGEVPVAALQQNTEQTLEEVEDWRMKVTKGLESCAQGEGKTVDELMSAAAEGHGDGRISEPELVSVYGSCDITLTDEQARILFASYDLRGGDSISLGMLSEEVKEEEVEELRAEQLASKPSTTAVPWSCKGGFVPVDQWTQEQKDWCCEHEEVDCPSTTVATTPGPVSTTTELPLNCEGGFVPVDQWTQEQRTWCCGHKQIGCPTTTAAAGCDTRCAISGTEESCRTHITTAAVSEFAAESEPCIIAEEWVIKQCAACDACTLAEAGCIDPMPVEHQAGLESMPFDCNAGFDNWELGWSKEQKAWCCENAGRACAPPAPAAVPVEDATQISGMRLTQTRAKTLTPQEQAETQALMGTVSRAVTERSEAEGETVEEKLEEKDQDGDGMLTEQEFAGALEAAGVTVSRDKVDELLSATGAENGAGEVQIATLSKVVTEETGASASYGRKYLQPAGVVRGVGAGKVMMLCTVAGCVGLLLLMAGSRGWSLTMLTRRAGAGAYHSPEEGHEVLAPLAGDRQEFSSCRELVPSRWRQRNSRYEALTEEANVEAAEPLDEDELELE